MLRMVQPSMPAAGLGYMVLSPLALSLPHPYNAPPTPAQKLEVDPQAAWSSPNECVNQAVDMRMESCILRCQCPIASCRRLQDVSFGIAGLDPHSCNGFDTLAHVHIVLPWAILGEQQPATIQRLEQQRPLGKNGARCQKSGKLPCPRLIARCLPVRATRRRKDLSPFRRSLSAGVSFWMSMTMSSQALEHVVMACASDLQSISRMSIHTWHCKPFANQYRLFLPQTDAAACLLVGIRKLQKLRPSWAAIILQELPKHCNDLVVTSAFLQLPTQL